MEQSREELAQQISGHSFSSTGNPVANLNEQSDCRFSPEVLSILTNPPPTNASAQRNLLRSHSERSQTLPEDIRVIQAGETAGFMKKISPGQCVMTSHDMDDGFGGAGWSMPRTYVTSK